MRKTSPEEARWEVWDRDRLIKLVEKMPDSLRIGISHHGESGYSVFRVWESRSVHLTFEDRPDEPHSVFVTKTYGRKSDEKMTIEWFAGGLRAWIDALEISRDELLAVLL